MKKFFSLFSFPLDTSKRVYGLDIMRSIAILLVMISHGRLLLRSAIPAIDFFHIGGFLGVELFFVLSGFLIGGILIKLFNSNEKFSSSTVRKFWIRRWFRTLPNYYLILLVNILFSFFLFHNLSKDYFSFIFFFQNFAWRHPHLFQEAWSLSVEEWFYLLLPICMLVIFYIARSKFSNKQIILLSVLSFIVTVSLLRVVYAYKYNLGWANDIRKVVVFRLDAIVWGVLAAWIAFYYKNAWNKFRMASFFISMFLLVIVVYFYYADVRSDHVSFFAKTFYFTLVSITGGVMLPLLSGLTFSGSPTRTQRFFAFTSVISYSLYLVHFSIVAQTISVTIHYYSPIRGVVSFFIFWIGSYLLSALLYKYYEKPFMDLRERFL